MNVHIVLVRTEHPGNIGAAARAAANMGAERVILIDPRCDVNAPELRQMAAGAREQARSLLIYKDWKAFYTAEGEGVRIALTRRGGRKRPVIPLPDQLRELDLAPQSGEKLVFDNLYLIFGPEADGLDSADLAYVNFTCHLPVYGEFGSLNLAQAVLLALYIARSHYPPSAMPKQVTEGNAPSVQPLYFPDALIKDWLTAMGFNIQARRASAYMTLRKLFLQNLPTRHEIQVLEAILQQNIRKLKSLRFGAEKLTDDGGDISV